MIQKLLKPVLRYKYLIVFLTFVGGVIYAVRNPHVWQEPYFKISNTFYFGYDADKQRIAPFFDADFYEKQYGLELQKTGLSPIDHFLQRNSGLLKQYFDPSPWFKTLAYQQRLFPCWGNGFLNYLNQPHMTVPKDAETIIVYANSDQYYRAWMAIEAFMRMNTYHVHLILPNTDHNPIPPHFIMQMQRGLKITFKDDKNINFYKSPFIQNPGKYIQNHKPATSLTGKEFHDATWANPITYVKRRKNFHYYDHRLYGYTNWYNTGRVDPRFINFARYHNEPIFISDFGATPHAFQTHMNEIAPLFDVVFTGNIINKQNSQSIPGYMQTWIDAHDIPQQKEYGVSFLMSLGRGGLENKPSRDASIYHYRKIIWGWEKKFHLPTKFYVSKRDIQNYPKRLQHRVMPTDSKKWIFGTQFALALENTRQTNYFTEKLLGCFVSMVVPIYIGCPNITDYFDPRGMIIATDPDDLMEKVSKITPETYGKMLPFLKENKKRAEQFLKLPDTLANDFYEQNIKN